MKTIVPGAGLVLALALLLIVSLGFAQQAAQKPQAKSPFQAPFSAVKVRDDIYMGKGGMGANTGFFIGHKAVLCVDSKMTAEASQQEVAAIARISPLPITTMVLTHSDLDHVNGLAGFPGGIKVIAQVNARKDMETAFADPELEAARAYLPGQTFTDRLSLEFDGQPVELFHFGPAHTNGDVVVFFPKERVAFVGDLVFIGRDPLIHLQKGGSSFGLVKNLKDILALDADVFVSGHADPVGRAEVRDLLTSIEAKQAKVKALIAEGKTLDQVKAEFGIANEAAPGGSRWPSLVEVIYKELTEK
jgi:cyclase